MDNILDIVKLIEKNPLTRLSKEYQNKFIEKIKQSFNDSQQQLFVSSFYCYLNYNSKQDFVIDLDKIWKWLGYERKSFCKNVLEKHFNIDIDYKVFLQMEKNFASPNEEAKNKIENRGGHNKETILLTIYTFKKLCLKSNTKKADEIHEYFIKLEEIFQEIINEESDELRDQLYEKENLIKSQLLLIKQKDKEIKQLNKKIDLDWLYVAIDNSIQGLSKIGIAEEILTRLDNHLTSNPGFKYVFTYQSKNNKLIEKCIKAILDPFLRNKKEWFTVDSEDMIQLVKFFIDIFDNNNGCENPKFIIKYIQELNNINVNEKINNKNVNEKINKCKKKVQQLSLDGEILNTFNSMTEAQNITGIKVQYISRICKGDRNQVKGFIWKYINE